MKTLNKVITVLVMILVSLTGCKHEVTSDLKVSDINVENYWEYYESNIPMGLQCIADMRSDDTITINSVDSLKNIESCATHANAKFVLRNAARSIDITSATNLQQRDNNVKLLGVADDVENALIAVVLADDKVAKAHVALAKLDK